MRYACLAGADQKTTKKSELEKLKKEKSSSFSVGFYYTKGYHY